MALITLGANSGKGKVLQVVQSVKTDTSSTTSTSAVDISGLSASITPSSASNKILILVQIGTAGQSNFNSRARSGPPTRLGPDLEI